MKNRYFLQNNFRNLRPEWSALNSGEIEKQRDCGGVRIFIFWSESPGETVLFIEWNCSAVSIDGDEPAAGTVVFKEEMFDDGEQCCSNSAFLLFLLNSKTSDFYCWKCFKTALQMRNFSAGASGNRLFGESIVAKVYSSPYDRQRVCSFVEYITLSHQSLLEQRTLGMKVFIQITVAAIHTLR